MLSFNFIFHVAIYAINLLYKKILLYLLQQ